jgi:hypothetical protein
MDLLKKVEYMEILETMDVETWPHIGDMIDRLEATAIVLFKNLELGRTDQTVMAIGPNCTYKSIEDVRGGHLGDTLSSHQYPIMWAEV